MSISTDWREQYDRMHRSYEDLLQKASGQISVPSAEARDALYHFFQDAYHFKDWLANNGAVSHNKAETQINSVTALTICADLCNGTKHFRLGGKGHPPRTGDPSTAFDSQGVNIHGPAAGATPPATGYAQHSWTVTSGGKTWDAIQLAGDVIAEWDKFLHAQGLLP